VSPWRCTPLRPCRRRFAPIEWRQLPSVRWSCQRSRIKAMAMNAQIVNATPRHVRRSGGRPGSGSGVGLGTGCFSLGYWVFVSAGELTRNPCRLARRRGRAERGGGVDNRPILGVLSREQILESLEWHDWAHHGRRGQLRIGRRNRVARFSPGRKGRTGRHWRRRVVRLVRSKPDARHDAAQALAAVERVESAHDVGGRGGERERRSAPPGGTTEPTRFRSVSSINQGCGGRPPRLPAAGKPLGRGTPRRRVAATRGGLPGWPTR